MYTRVLGLGIVVFSAGGLRAEETPPTWPDKMPPPTLVTKLLGTVKPAVIRASQVEPKVLAALAAIEAADFTYACTKIEIDYRTGRLSAEARQKGHARNVARKAIDAGLDVIALVPIAAPLGKGTPSPETLHKLFDDELAALIQPEVNEVLRELDHLVDEEIRKIKAGLQKGKETLQTLKEESAPAIEAGKQKAEEAGRWLEKHTEDTGAVLRARWDRWRK